MGIDSNIFFALHSFCSFPFPLWHFLWSLVILVNAITTSGFFYTSYHSVFHTFYSILEPNKSVVVFEDLTASLRYWLKVYSCLLRPLPQVLCITWNILTISRLLFGPRQNRKGTVGIWRFWLTDSGFFLGIFSVAFLPPQEGYNVPREQVAVIQHQHKQHHHHFSLACTFSMFCCGVILIIIILICNIITSFVSLFYIEFQIEMFGRTVLVPSQLCGFSFSVSLNGFMLTHFSAFFLSPCVCVILRFFRSFYVFLLVKIYQSGKYPW